MIERRHRNHHSAHQVSKIHQALELLNEAAHDKREELFEALASQYGDFKQVITDVNKGVRKQAVNAKKKTERFLREGEKKIEETASEAAAAVDEKVHEKPWFYIGTAAAAAFLVGYVMRKR